MLAKYSIAYSVPFRRHARTDQHHTDDPVAAKEFLEELLDRGLRIVSIHHDGMELPRKEADQLVKGAAHMLAAKRICASLGISADEEHFRFGLTA